jgi:molecular chaperone GrpE
MSDSKQTIDQAAPGQAGADHEEQSSERARTPEQAPPTPGADAPGVGGGARRPPPPPPAPARGPAAGAIAAADRGDEPDHAPVDGSVELKGDLDELGALAAKRDEYLALAQRTQADFENYRKRVARESALALQRGVAKLAKELAPAIDNLDRALDSAATDDPLLDGVRLVRSELSAALARVGVESFSPLGETFDPSVHEAVATVQQPAEGGAASGLVVEVYQDGYRLGDSVIRPARVVVAA